jgi:hypothetical protein
MTANEFLKEQVLNHLKTTYPKAYIGEGNGIYDLFLILKGEFIALKIKSDKRPLSPKINKAINDIISAGGHYYIIFTMDDLIDYLEKFN